jgi:hypothetical protein
LFLILLSPDCDGGRFDVFGEHKAARLTAISADHHVDGVAPALFEGAFVAATTALFIEDRKLVAHFDSPQSGDGGGA